MVEVVKLLPVSAGAGYYASSFCIASTPERLKRFPDNHPEYLFCCLGNLRSLFACVLAFGFVRDTDEHSRDGQGRDYDDVNFCSIPLCGH